ncbi:MAG TPA: glycosyltransferase [Acidimicrobiales bacterium]
MTAAIDVAVPVFNEAAQLDMSVRRLRDHLDRHLPWPATVTIVDNGSTDGTGAIGDHLAAELSGVRCLHLAEKGRGRALRAAWTASDAEVVAYTDVDLSTGLDALLPLVALLVAGHSDIAIGSRLAAGSRVARGARRELVSRAYNFLLRVLTGARFTDAQCGFKALRADVARSVLPLVRDEEWFFDTELLLIGQRNGLRIHEVAVEWVDDLDSRVDVVATAVADLRGIARTLVRFGRGEGLLPETGDRPAVPDVRVSAFAGVGILSTVAYMVLFLLLRPIGVLAANAIALAVTAVLNALGHRFVSFAGRPVRGNTTLSAGLFVAGLAVSTAALAVVGLVSDSVLAELLAIALAGSVVSTIRFVALRALALPPRRVRRAGLATDDEQTSSH